MPQENLTNNSNPQPAQAESEPITEPALTEPQASETVEKSAPILEEAKIDIELEPVQSEESQQTPSEGQPSENQQSVSQQPENPQIAEEPPKLEEIAEMTQPTRTAGPAAISQQSLDKLSEQIIPPAQDIILTEEQKRSFWQKVMQRLSRLSGKKRQNRWQMQRMAILKLLAQKGRIKNDDVEQALGVSHRSGARYLNKLIREQLIERHNKKKQTFYLITPAGQKQISAG